MINNKDNKTTPLFGGFKRLNKFPLDPSNIHDSISDLQSDIFIIYNDEGKLSRKRTSDKIIEIPRERINSLLKEFTNVNIQYSTKDNIGARYVILSSENKELNLELSEIYKTI